MISRNGGQPPGLRSSLDAAPSDPSATGAGWSSLWATAGPSLPWGFSMLRGWLIGALLAVPALVEGVVPAVATTAASSPPGASATETAYLVAVSSTPVTVYDGPDDAGSARLLDPADEVSGQLVFLVRSQAAEWLEVHLPVRPNGSIGWLRRSDVEVSAHRYRVELSLSTRRLVLFHGADVVMDEPIGVGAENTPTPGGLYYIKELLRPPEPSGFYGPYAYGLSGFSNVLTDYRGGQGVLGLHGTDDPASVGRQVSNGCIRLHNHAITRLVEEVGLPVGTPVVVDA